MAHLNLIKINISVGSRSIMPHFMREICICKQFVNSRVKALTFPKMCCIIINVNRKQTNIRKDVKLKIRTRIFDTIDKAFELFTLMSKYFVYGLYSTNDRFEIFQNWSGENAEAK